MSNIWKIEEKRVLITGATDGIGKETARQLAEKGAEIIIHGRDKLKTENTAEEIIMKTGNKKIDFIIRDLSSLKEIKKMAEELKRNYDRLDILINNAGVFSHQRELSQDGFELTFAVNYLSHFYLTHLLLGLLKNSAPSRIINVSSMAHSSELDISNLQGELNYNGYQAYSYSKLLNILFTFELAEKTAKLKITSNCLHPGVINTKLLKAGWGLGGGSVKEGASTSVFLASSGKIADITGKYFVNSRISEPASIAYDKILRKEIWNKTIKLLKIKNFGLLS